MTSHDRSSAGLTDALNRVPASMLDTDFLATSRPVCRQGKWARRQSICCTMALQITEYHTQPVFDQIRLTQNFQELLSFATAQTTPDDLVSIVGEDGALLCFSADSKACFRAALSIRKAISIQERYRCLPLRIGIDLCEVDIAEDEFGNAYLGGAGRQDAERVMRQCLPHQICATRSFLELLSRTAPELAGLLQYQGPVSDINSPPLEFYRLDPKSKALLDDVPGTPLAAAVSSSTTRASIGLRARPVRQHLQVSARNRYPRFWAAYVFIMLLAAGATATWLYSSRGEPLGSKPAKQPAPITPARPRPETESRITPPTPHETNRPLPAPRDRIGDLPRAPTNPISSGATSGREARSAARRADRSPTTAAVQVAEPDEPRKVQQLVVTYPTTNAELSSPAMPRGGTLLLAIKPWGQVYVDGMQVGLTPPLTSVQVSSGRRQVTIRNGTLPMYERTIRVKPDATITLTHDFGCGSRWENPCRAQFGRDSSYVRD